MKREKITNGSKVPSISGSIRSDLALPGTMELAPIRIPRPRAEAFPPIIEDYPAGRYVQRSAELSDIPSLDIFRKPNVETIPSARLMETSSAFSFPAYTEERSAASVRIRSQTGLENVQISTDAMPATLPRIRNNPIITTGNLNVDSMEVPPGPLKQGIVSGSDDKPDDIKARAIFNNFSISYQRFVFSLLKFPALVLVFVSLWTLWSRGQYSDKTEKISDEQNAAITSLCTGGFILSAYVLLIQNHHNCYSKAKAMIYLYHIVSLGAFAGSTIGLIFGSIGISKLKSHIPPGDRPIHCVHYNQFKNCLTYQDKLTYESIIIGTNAMIIFFSVTTMLFGGFAQYLLPKKLKEEYLKISEHRTYTNQGLSF
ncbi:unnamed protein product [Auanema sp. JU1783]|nr:unnamed protein product [Auanema sp. JU1783]